MRRYSRQYRARRRMFSLLLMLMMTTVFLVSCVAGGSGKWFKSLLGLDVYDYIAEAVEAECEVNGALADSLSETIRIVLGNGIHLEGFQTTAQAVGLYRDRILNYMLCTNYARYTGNEAAIEAVESVYPRTVVSTLISTDDFESTVYRFFGMGSVDHKNSGAFQYLSKAGYYTSPLCAREAETVLRVLSLHETANTYRMQFVLSNGEETSEPYTALFVKREDGSCYWKALEM